MRMKLHQRASFIFLLFSTHLVIAQSAIQNVPGRKQTSLNGKWQAIVDHADVGDCPWSGLWKDRKPTDKADFVEYAYDGNALFDVPCELNTQLPELKYYESTIWYKKTFATSHKAGKKLFLYFDAANYQTDVYLNSVKLGSHEGGFTPFQFDITDKVREGSNTLIVRVNNQRQKNGVPSLDYDWFNYGGITRDVRLIETPSCYIDDYFIQADKKNPNRITGYVQLKGASTSQRVKLCFDGAGKTYSLQTDKDGYARVDIEARLNLWSPENPVLHAVELSTATDTVCERIGFRTIETRGTRVFLNGKAIFLKGINFHEEIAQRKGRACTEADAQQVLNEAKELGCNFIRTAHYAQNEYLVRLAEKMGFMIWEEIPVFQAITFENAGTQALIKMQMRETIRRDKNRCGIIIWSVANETASSPIRNKVLAETVALCRSLDNTRLVSAAFNNMVFDKDKVLIQDSLIEHLDLIGINEYIGWYTPWKVAPEKTSWVSDYNKPLIITEFGAEAMYSIHENTDLASSWSEEYMAKVYTDQISMMQQIPFLCGCCPWILSDFRSPRRMHPVYQNGWNRKGLLSDKGYKKQAWYIMHDCYTNNKLHYAQ